MLEHKIEPLLMVAKDGENYRLMYKPDMNTKMPDGTTILEDVVLELMKKEPTFAESIIAASGRYQAETMKPFIDIFKPKSNGKQIN